MLVRTLAGSQDVCTGVSARPGAEAFYVMATPPRSNKFDELRLTTRLLEQMKTTCATVMWPLTAAVLLFIA